MNFKTFYQISEDAFQKFSESNMCKTVVVIGDIMLDRYIHGESDRVSPEAPVLVVNKKNESVTLGGAGNVVNNLYELGISPLLFTLVGKDQSGSVIRKLLEDRGVSVEGIVESNDRPTTEKIRVLSHNQQIVRIDQENTEDISDDIQENLISLFKQRISNIDAVVISDYQKGVCRTKLITTIIQLCKKKDVPVFVDSKAKDYSIFAGASCITPNTKEISAALHCQIDSERDVEIAAQNLQNLVGIPHVIVTRGAKGMYVLSDQEHRHIHTKAKQVYDVSGAGDTVISTLVAAVLSGIDWMTSAEITNIAAGTVVAKIGTTPVNKKELLEVLNQSSEHASKIYDWTSAKLQIDNSRKIGKKIVFTNGCFDILHIGHIKMLEAAKNFGDLLIVGLNSDQSVRRLKGQERPINPEKDRAQMLASLEKVDVVVIFDEDTPEQLIQVLCPDVLVKGADYKVEEVAGATFVLENGGEVKLIPLEKGKSTTGLVQKLRNDF